MSDFYRLLSKRNKELGSLNSELLSMLRAFTGLATLEDLREAYTGSGLGVARDFDAGEDNDRGC